MAKLNQGDCNTTENNLEFDVGFLEREVIAGFRVWQLGFFSGVAFLCLVIALCCIYPCRIPRTIQEIEADFARKHLAEQFTEHLRKLSIKKELGDALPAVTAMEQQRILREKRIHKRNIFQRIRSIFCGCNDDPSPQRSTNEEPESNGTNDTTEDISELENQETNETTKADGNDIKIEFISVI